MLKNRLMSQENQEQEINITSKHDFYFETPLYERIPLGCLEDNLFSGDVDAYSNVLQDNTTYHIDFDWFDNWEKWESPEHRKIGYAEVTLTCKRKSNDVLRFLVYRDATNAGFVEKVGQDPSMADLQLRVKRAPRFLLFLPTRPSPSFAPDASFLGTLL